MELNPRRLRMIAFGIVIVANLGFACAVYGIGPILKAFHFYASIFSQDSVFSHEAKAHQFDSATAQEIYGSRLNQCLSLKSKQAPHAGFIQTIVAPTDRDAGIVHQDRLNHEIYAQHNQQFHLPGLPNQYDLRQDQCTGTVTIKVYSPKEIAHHTVLQIILVHGTNNIHFDSYGTSGSDWQVPGFASQKEAADNYPYSERYPVIVQNQIAKNWMPPKVPQNAQAIALFKVSRDGQIEDIHFKTPSPIASVNEAAINAIRKSAPFPAFPDSYQQNSVWVEFTFDDFPKAKH